MATYSSINDGWYQLAQLANLDDQNQQKQQAMQQMANPGYIYQQGSAMPYTTGTATQATLSTNFSYWQDACNRIMKLKFWRVNQVVEMNDGTEFTDPLDKLRVTVARWLKPNEKYNFV